MSALSHPPLRLRVPPAAWTATAWFAGLALTFVARVRLPGEVQPEVYPGVLLYRWDGMVTLAVATALTLTGCRLLTCRPLAGVGLMLGASALASTALSVAEIPLMQFLAVDIALYVVAANRPRRTALTALGLALATLAGYLILRLLCGWTVGMSAEITVALTAVIAWLVGDAARQGRAAAEQARDQAAVQAVTAERLRISRELHDMVAHSIGVIALQAGAARRVVGTRPEHAREALEVIETTGRETLSGLRRMLVALREADPETPGGTGGLEPGPGLADVDRLAAATTAAGVRVDVTWRGEPRPLPPDIDLSAYRIVQEAVTNVVRHAGARSCAVSIERGDDAVAIEVLDDGGGGTRPPGAGFGLTGMRERVGLLHGEFSAAPRPCGGFRVAARLPVPAGAR